MRDVGRSRLDMGDGDEPGLGCLDGTTDHRVQPGDGRGHGRDRVGALVRRRSVTPSPWIVISNRSAEAMIAPSLVIMPEGMLVSMIATRSYRRARLLRS